MSRRKLAPILAWLIAAALAVWPVASARAADGVGRPVIRAMKVIEPPVIDGEVLADPAWSAASPASGFTQNTPDEGDAASEQTEVRIVYTDDTLYVGVVCFDRAPQRIIVASSRRDSSLEETDSFQLVLDTYRDGQTGFVFGTNPAGIEYDGQVSREGEGSFGSPAAFNRNWDGVWQVEARVSEIGWTAEFAIPFRSLRFPRGAAQTWNVNFQRNIRRRNERAFWAPLPRQYDLYRLSLTGTLEGVEVPDSRNLKLTPYGLVEGRKEGIAGAAREESGEVGLDVKYGITPSLTLDATVNTDFAQVEADELQINLDRFNLFFPEKRPFFLENAGLFSVGVPEEIELFLTRRIGVGPGGQRIPIRGGARLSGKAARKYNVGVLVMRTEAVEPLVPRDDFAVARLSRDLPNRSHVGAIVTSREGADPAGGGTGISSRTYGLDGRFGLGGNGLLHGFAARTQSPGPASDEHAFRLGGRYDSEAWSFSAAYTEVGESFDPAAGFLTRRGYRKPDVFVMRRIRPADLWGLHELRPHVSYRGFWNFDGFQTTGFLHVDNHAEWKNGYELHTGVNFTREGLTEPFEIFPGVIVPVGTYDHSEAQIVFYTNRGAPAGFELRTTAGGFFGGDRVALTPSAWLRVREKFVAELRWTRNDIDLPGGSFETNLGRLRVSYSFTPRIFVQALVQHNDRADVRATNLRFAWLHEANAGLWIVYDEFRDIEGAGTGIPDRSLIVKYSRVFDVFR